MRMTLQIHSVKGAKTTTELCPPNPKELDIAAQNIRAVRINNY
jgi:hypothetical protein